jgi:hypothetical protein
VRPEDVVITEEKGHPATVVDVVPLGPVMELALRLAGGGDLTAVVPHTPGAARPAIGSTCRVLIRRTR